MKNINITKEKDIKNLSTKFLEEDLYNNNKKINKHKIPLNYRKNKSCEKIITFLKKLSIITLLILLKFFIEKKRKILNIIKLMKANNIIKKNEIKNETYNNDNNVTKNYKE